MTQTTTYAPAVLWRRLAAMIYDSLIVMALIMAYGAAVLGVKYGLLGVPLAEGQRASMGIAGLMGLPIFLALYFSFCWHRSGQTVGMKAWRLQMLQPNGQFPSWKQGMLRSVLAPLSLLCLGIGYFWCLFDEQGQTLHDKLTNTLVVQLPKPAKKS